ncbi:Actin cross-linking [Senna tora]|uniref:Actin cross-linking n=1 Tax=Senna tora TaxID=362788 RepID=A0A834WFV2_9FABA|nr:Actin cross-linking [Senna tora]
MGNLRIWVLSLFVFGFIALLPMSDTSPSHHNFEAKVEPKPKADTTKSHFKVRGTNLGGWLVIEGWIKPSLFHAIPNKDFLLWRINANTFRFRVARDHFVGLEGTQVVAVVTNDTESATFEIIRESQDSKLVRIKASNGHYLQVKTENLVTADVSKVSGWGDNDPTVFDMTFVKMANGDTQIHGDFQLQNGKYGLKVILDLHAAPGSQNGVAHSATRDGSIGWGKTHDNIQQTLEVIEFFAKRYGQHESIYGFELLNEPLYPYVTLKTVEDYSRAAHKIIRKYNPTVYVIFSVRLSFTSLDVPSYLELFPLANSLDHTVVDIHWYTFLYATKAREFIDYIKNNRTRQMAELLSNNGEALVYIGEWSCTWSAKNATSEELTEFAKAQIEVYSRSSFAAYIAGRPLYWHLTEGFAAVRRDASHTSCPPCRCDCSLQPLISLPEGLTNNSIIDCMRQDPEVSEEMQNGFLDLLSEEVKLKEAEALEKHRRADMALLEAKKLASQYQKEADKCNSGMETCEEAREKAEEALESQRKVTALWELRARQRGWNSQ